MKVCPRFGALLLLLAIQDSICLGTGAVADTNADELQIFFNRVDADGDGEIQQAEADQFMELHGGESVEDSDVSEPHPVKEVFNYGGTTISSPELNSHLKHMLTGERVAEWVTHGLRLPHYSEAFRKNSIDGLDFPLLISDTCTALQDDLGVNSPLHRKKIQSALFRQIFGLGRVPSPALALECQPTPCGSLQLQWDPPADLGLPPVHKYLVQRRVMGTRGAGWVELGDPREDALVDESLAADVGYVYRVQAWGGHGASEWVAVEDCRTSVAPDCSKEDDVATARWQTDGSRSQTDGSRSGDEPEAVSYFRRGLMVVMALLVGVLSRNALFLALFFKVISRAQGKVGDVVRRMYEGSKSSPYRLLRCIHPTVQAGARGVVVVRDRVQSAVGAMTGSEVGGVAMRSGRLGGLDVSSTLLLSTAASPDSEPTESGGRPKARSGRSDGGGSESMRGLGSEVLTARSLPGSLSEGGGDGGDGNALLPMLEETQHTNSARSKHRCNQDGCKTRFDRWQSPSDWYNAKHKHFCRTCQSAYCQKHTRYANHEGWTSCALQTRCMCSSCFDQLLAEDQNEFDKNNRIRLTE